MLNLVGHRGAVRPPSLPPWNASRDGASLLDLPTLSSQTGKCLSGTNYSHGRRLSLTPLSQPFFPKLSRRKSDLLPWWESAQLVTSFSHMAEPE